jgi:uncharacterized protein (TIGR01244 family)
MIHAAALLSLSLLAWLQTDPQPTPSDPDLPGLRQITPEIATAAQPSEEGLAKLQLRGFRTVINVRADSELALDERLAVEKLGMAYHQIPVRSDELDPEAVDRFLTALDSAARPVLVHCASGNRVGALWLIYRLRDGVELEQARAEAGSIGLRSAALEAKALALAQGARRAPASQPETRPESR